WFTAPRYGTSGVLWLGLFLVVLAASAWTFGEFFQKIRTKGRWIAVAVCLLLLAGGYFGILEGELAWRSKVTRVADGNSLKESPDGIDWQRWSPEAVAKARAEGH